MRHKLAFMLLLVFGISGCNLALTAEEAKEALEESKVASQALTLSMSSTTISKNEGTDTVEVETTFTIGDAVRARAERIREFIQSQVDCAEYTIDDSGTLTTEYGAIEGEDCEYLGHQYSGTHSITVDRITNEEVLVAHEWDQFSDRSVTVTGWAEVTWNRKDRSRHIEHELRWQSNSPTDQRGGRGSGDRTQTVLEDGLLVGIEVNGTREWEGKLGSWNLDIDGIEMRWADPVPQDGTWTLTTPFDGKELILDFDRQDENTIEVTAESGRRSFSFNVIRSGKVTQK